MMLQDRFLPGVPGDDIERILNAAPGDEIKSGKFDSPESSSALAVNTFGFFLSIGSDQLSLTEPIDNKQNCLKKTVLFNA